MIDLTETQTAVLNQIKGRRKINPVTGTKVANAIGLRPRDAGKDGADLRAVVNALRQKGYPILASGEGYYWPTTRREIEEYMESLQGRIDKAQEALTGMREGISRWDREPEIREPEQHPTLEI